MTQEINTITNLYNDTKDFLSNLEKVISELQDIKNNKIEKIDKRKKYTCLIDVETIGVSNRSCYDISYLILDNNANVIDTKSFVVSEVFDDINSMQQAYYFEKVFKYLHLLERGVYIKKTMTEIVKEMNKDFKKYNISVLTAYNSRFDVSALKYTISKYSDIELNFPQQLECVWHQASHIIMNDDYRQFCIENNYITQSGKYFQSNAEVCYKYLTKQLGIKEEHIGLYDCFIHEVRILQECINSKKKLTKEQKSPSSTVWRKLEITQEEFDKIQEMRANKGL